jgi:hypothetical protein
MKMVRHDYKFIRFQFMPDFKRFFSIHKNDIPEFIQPYFINNNVTKYAFAVIRTDCHETISKGGIIPFRQPRRFDPEFITEEGHYLSILIWITT